LYPGAFFVKTICLHIKFRLKFARSHRFLLYKDMEKLVLVSKHRNALESAKNLRKAKIIPAVFYGKGEESISLQVNYQEFRKLFKTTGFTGVFDLEIDGKMKPVLVHDLQFHPLDDTFMHIDLLHVNLKQKIVTQVPVEVIGVSAAVKNEGAIVTIAKHEVEVKCLPLDIPHSIQIDLALLEKVGDSFYVSDLKLGDKVEIHAEPEDLLVTISAPRVMVEEQDVSVPQELKAEPAAEGAVKEGEKKEDKDKE